MNSNWFYFLLISILLGCSNSNETRPDPIPQGLPEVPKPDRVWNVGLLIMEGVYNTELTAPMDIFQHTIYHDSLGMKVFTIAKTLNPLHTFEGLEITPDYSYRDATFPPIDILVVPSAEHHLDTDLEDEEMIDFVKKSGKKAQYIMSLCDGAFVLAKAGLLDGHESTTFPSDIPAYREMFPQLVVHEKVLFVHDGYAITSAGGAKSFEPALYLCELLYGKKAANGIAKGMVIDWNVAQIPHKIVAKTNQP